MHGGDRLIDATDLHQSPLAQTQEWHACTCRSTLDSQRRPMFETMAAVHDKSVYSNFIGPVLVGTAWEQQRFHGLNLLSGPPHRYR